jgi:hypothetical protein
VSPQATFNQAPQALPNELREAHPRRTKADYQTK